MREFKLNLIYILLILLSGCSTLSKGQLKEHIAESSILPSYASIYGSVMPGGSVWFGNDLLLTDGSRIPFQESYSLVLLVDNYSTLPSVSSSAVSEQNYYDMGDSNLYPLLSTNIDLIIIDSYQPVSNNTQTLVDSIPMNFVLADYVSRTLQPKNQESALRNSALLANRSQFASPLRTHKLQIRAEYLDMSKAALTIIYARQPDLKLKFESAAAFGVFELNNYNALFYVGAYGKGVIFDNQDKKVIYMYTSRAGTGPGIGYESLYAVFVFKNRVALQQFIGAKGFGGDIGASATFGIIGGQISFNPEISIYQIYKNGFDLQADWGGTVYFPANGLND